VVVVEVVDDELKRIIR